MQFDSLLFGNGLTIALTKRLVDSVHCKADMGDAIHFADMNSYIRYIVGLKDSSREIRDFRKTFKGFKYLSSDKVNAQKEWNAARGLLADNIKSLTDIGAEQWLGSVLFKPEFEELYRPHKEVLYSLYNYWYLRFCKCFSDNTSYLKICGDMADNLKVYGIRQIYTINFDMMLDNWLRPKHLHGRFIKYSNYNDLRIFEFKDGVKKSEYPYLFGTNGVEKCSRLSRINKNRIATDYYDTKFFFDKNIHLGNLLIYGIGFGTTGFFRKEFSTNLDDTSIMSNVDGHILLRLRTLYDNNALDSITITYYSMEDLENYKELFASSGIDKITTFIHCDEVSI